MPGKLDPDVFWRKGPVEFAERTGTDARIGRRAWTLMRAAGLRDVPCLVHHVADDRADALRDVLRPPTTAASLAIDGFKGTSETTAASILNVALAAMRLVAAVPDGQVSVVKTVAGARLSIDLPFEF